MPGLTRAPATSRPPTAGVEAVAAAVIDWLKSFIPAAQGGQPIERLRVVLGTGIALLCLALSARWLFDARLSLAIIASAASSAVVVFAAPSSAFAQPWPLLGGNLLAALVGVSMAQTPVPGLWAEVLAGCLSLALSFWLRCLHPPSCALAMIAAMDSPTYGHLGYGLLLPVLFYSSILLGCALLYHNLSGRTYPTPPVPRQNRHGTADTPPPMRLGTSPDDLDRALLDFGEYVDLSRDDLERLIRLAEQHSLRRLAGGIRAADLMSRDVRHVRPGQPIGEAWTLIREHCLRALPVIENEGRLVGLLTVFDLLSHYQARARSGFGPVRLTLRQARVAQLMNSPVSSVSPDADLSELVQLLSEQGLHCVPVVDDEQRLLGMITQTDLVVALYRQLLLSGEGPQEAAG